MSGSTTAWAAASPTSNRAWRRCCANSGARLLFLDSRTTAKSAAIVAQELGVPSVARNVFLDDDESLDAVHRRLAETEAVAAPPGLRRRDRPSARGDDPGAAEWLPTVAAKGFVLAPLSAVLRKRNGWD